MNEQHLNQQSPEAGLNRNEKAPSAALIDRNRMLQFAGLTFDQSALAADPDINDPQYLQKHVYNQPPAHTQPYSEASNFSAAPLYPPEVLQADAYKADGGLGATPVDAGQISAANMLDSARQYVDTVHAGYQPQTATQAPAVISQAYDTAPAASYEDDANFAALNYQPDDGNFGDLRQEQTNGLS